MIDALGAGLVADVGTFGTFIDVVAAEATMTVLARVGDGTEAAFARALVARLAIATARIRVALVGLQHAFVRVTADESIANEAFGRALALKAAVAVGASRTRVTRTWTTTSDDRAFVDIRAAPTIAREAIWTDAEEASGRVDAALRVEAVVGALDALIDLHTSRGGLAEAGTANAVAADEMW